MEVKRRHYLDNIRWTVTIAVILYHVIYMYNAQGIPGVLGPVTNQKVQYQDVYQYFVYPWLMPIFFIVSGISANLYLKSHTGKEFAKDRTVRLLVPTTIGLVAFHFVQGIINIQLSNAYATMSALPFPGNVIGIAIATVLSGIGVLWYMQLLWLICMILLLIRVIEKGRLVKAAEKTPIWLVFLFAIAAWGAGLILNTPIIAVYRLGFYTVFFLLGYFVFSSETVMEKMKKIFPVFLVIAIGLGVAFSIIYFGDNYADKPINRGILFALYGYFGSLAILSGFAKFFDFSNAFTSFMSRKSLGLYMFHYLGISAVALLVAKKGILPGAVIYLLSLLAGFATGFGLYALISLIPGYRVLVLGYKKKKAEKDSK
ncbi:MAG: acyltransferase [Lachnospiraceae bacterium]|nr:acyltransferase [Lachnospiraceae bacterium]